MNNNDNALDEPPVSFSNGNLEIEPVAVPQTNMATGSIDVEHSQESTRSKIALMFTQFFLIIIAIAFIGPFIMAFIDPRTFPNPAEVSKNLVTETASVLAGPFGFIVGFYFKQGNSK
jgi:hypothetical protein